MDNVLKSWSDIADHPSIVGKLVTVINPNGMSVRGPIQSVSFHEQKRRVAIVIRPGEMQMSQSADRPNWVCASEEAEVIDFTIGANCTAPDFTLEATTAMIGVGISLSISHIKEHALTD